jgi:hypothetical protein
MDTEHPTGLIMVGVIAVHKYPDQALPHVCGETAWQLGSLAALCGTKQLFEQPRFSRSKITSTSQFPNLTSVSKDVQVIAKIIDLGNLDGSVLIQIARHIYSRHRLHPIQVAGLCAYLTKQHGRQERQRRPRGAGLEARQQPGAI